MSNLDVIIHHHCSFKWEIGLYCEIDELKKNIPRILSSDKHPNGNTTRGGNETLESTKQIFGKLTLVQKLETFEAVLKNTQSQDLNKILWLTSNSSENWVDRRFDYTRSLAVMSMVGYILGLGDRHPRFV